MGHAYDCRFGLYCLRTLLSFNAAVPKLISPLQYCRPSRQRQKVSCRANPPYWRGCHCSSLCGSSWHCISDSASKREAVHSPSALAMGFASRCWHHLSNWSGGRLEGLEAMAEAPRSVDRSRNSRRTRHSHHTRQPHICTQSPAVEFTLAHGTD